MERVAAIVLAGGRSSRMGRPKAALVWHDQTLLARAAGILARSVAGPVVVVRAPGQELPPLPPGIAVVEDAREGRGPLEGIAAGLRAVETHAEAAFVSSIDLPLLRPSFVRAVVDALDGGSDIAVPAVDGRLHPLASAYRTALRSRVEELLREDELRVSSVLDRVRTRLVGEDELRRADPELRSLTNVNEPEEYARLVALDAPQVRVELGESPEPHVAAWTTIAVRAATLGAAADAIGLRLDETVVTVLSGELVESRVGIPLVDGDRVWFKAGI